MREVLPACVGSHEVEQLAHIQHIISALFLSHAISLQDLRDRPPRGDSHGRKKWYMGGVDALLATNFLRSRDASRKSEIVFLQVEAGNFPRPRLFHMDVEAMLPQYV